MNPYGGKSEMGICVLSKEDKTSQPSSYRVSDTDVEYIENQCVERCKFKIAKNFCSGCKKYFLPAKASSYCSYEHYEHSTLSYPELEIMNLDETKVRL
jgi:hypothetical protein